MNFVLWVIVAVIFGGAFLILFCGFINKPNHPPDDDFPDLDPKSLNSQDSKSEKIDPENKTYFP